MTIRNYFDPIGLIIIFLLYIFGLDFFIKGGGEICRC